MGTLEGTIAALIMERGNAAIWAIKWDTKLLTAAYSVNNSQVSKTQLDYHHLHHLLES